MAKRLAPQERDLFPGATRNVGVDFSGLLDDGETLTGISSLEEDTSSLAITAPQINDGEIKINGKTVPANHAVLFRVGHNGASAGSYVLDITCTTSAGQTVPGSVILQVH